MFTVTCYTTHAISGEVTVADTVSAETLCNAEIIASDYTMSNARYIYYDATIKDGDKIVARASGGVVTHVETMAGWEAYI